MDKNNINKLFEAFTPKEEYKEKMFYEILSKSKNRKKRGFSPVKRPRLAILTATILICLFATTTFAIVYIGLDAKFLNFLKPNNNAQSEYLANGAYVVDKQISNENGTIDIKQVIGDSNLTYILMELTAREDIILDAKRYNFEDTSFDIGAGFFTDTDIILIDDENPKDNKISIVVSMITKNSMIGKKLNIKFTDLIGSGELYPAEFKTIIPGTWETSFKLDFKECSNTYQVNEKISMFDYDAVLKSISVSPISIAIKVESASIKDISNAATKLREISPNKYIDLDTYPIIINYKDGSSEKSDDFKRMSIAQFHLEDLLTIKTFENVINDKEIKSIEFFDMIIPINN